MNIILLYRLGLLRERHYTNYNLRIRARHDRTLLANTDETSYTELRLKICTSLTVILFILLLYLVAV